ncbi:hypothetical protein ACH3VR_22175 [Microbacterium sp. B2969]|uniref:Uncharacterized protein n=1 Tax=Microbacterium alkaliflavum TaxID=3248839 RepID=A0ABW7QDV6_9MICO
MTALPQQRTGEAQQFALQSWIRKTGTTAIFLLTGAVSILLAIVFGTDIWRILLTGILLVILLVSLVVIVIGVADIFRDDS